MFPKTNGKQKKNCENEKSVSVTAASTGVKSAAVEYAESDFIQRWAPLAALILSILALIKN